VKIVNLPDVFTEQMAQQLAALIHIAFPGADGYPTMDSAHTEVKEALSEDRVNFVALDELGDAVGWIGGIETYNGNVYELHPLVIREDWRGQDLGTMLLETFEKRVAELGAVTIYLGTDDVSNGTNIFGLDLYPDPLRHAMGLESINNHPMAFYRKQGYVVVGIMPDANGLGQPDIIMAKRIISWDK